MEVGEALRRTGKQFKTDGQTLHGWLLLVCKLDGKLFTPCLHQP